MADVIETNHHVHETLLSLEAGRRAGADPLPGPAGDAFALHGDIRVGPFTVRRVVASDWKILKAIDSPIIKMLLELRQDPTSTAEVPIEPEEEWELAYQFTRPVAEARAALAQGRDKFRAAASAQIGDAIDEPLIKLISSAVLEQIRRSWLSAVSYKQQLEKEGEVTFFPVAEANPKMASAGGSITSGA